MSARETSWGLVAVGTSGGWSVEVDQSGDEAGSWQLQIESRTLELRFPINGPRSCEQLRKFLTTSNQSPNSDELLLGSGMTVLRDDEFANRFFLLVQLDDAATVRLCIAGDDLNCFREALDQVHSDLVSDGVLS